MNGGPADLNLLLVFEAMLRERSVTRAARSLGIGQPAASNALSRLRASLKDELFVRVGNAMQPTAKAVELAQPIEAALALLRGAMAEGVPFDPGSSARRFRVSAGDYAAMLLVPPLVRRLTREAPAVDLRCRFAEKDQIPGLLDAGTLDLAVGVFPAAPKRFRLRRLLTETFVAVLRAGHPAAARPLDAEAYAALPHVLVTERGDETGAVDEALRAAGLRRRVAVTVSHLSLVPDLLAGNDFVATIGARAAMALAGTGKLALCAAPVAIPPWELSVLSARQRQGDAALAWLIDRIADCAAEVRA